jgi:hypothetical protein
MQTYKSNTASLAPLSSLRRNISNKLSRGINITKPYFIQCKANMFNLREELKQYKKETDILRVTGTKENENSPSQYWYLKPSLRKDNSIRYEIIHIHTDLVITVESDGVRLERGKQKNGQFF